MGRHLINTLAKLSVEFFFGKHINVDRKQTIKDLTEMRKDRLPFTYLGAPIFEGVPKASFLKKIRERVCSQYAGWKGESFSIAGRAQLVKSVVQDRLVYNLLIYKWPNNLPQKMDMYAKNFIYMGDIHT